MRPTIRLDLASSKIPRGGYWLGGARSANIDAAGPRWLRLMACGLLMIAGPAAAQLIVDDTSTLFDFDLDDGVCQVCYLTDVTDQCVQPGGCSLNAAIQLANQSPDLDIIQFAVPSITSSNLGFPAIETQIILDGSVGGGRVRLLSGGANVPGLRFEGPGSADSEVLGVEVSGFPTGIEFRFSLGGTVQNCVVRNTEPTSVGISAISSEATLIGGRTDQNQGNTIVGNGRGVFLSGTGDHKVFGNLIGIEADGQANGNEVGILVEAGAGEGTMIGDGNPRHRNVIGNNTTAGIVASGTAAIGSSQDVRLLEIYGNYIGTNALGTEAAPNGRGIELIRSDGVRIGRGSWPDPRGNLISGNGIEGDSFPWAGAGVYLNNRNVNTFVEANTVGISLPFGRLPNEEGVVVRGQARDVEVANNWISGNEGNGVVLTRINNFIPEENRILFNNIGVEPSEVGSFSNETLRNGANGVLLENAEFNRVAHNRIGNSVGDGVRLTGGQSTENFIERNEIGGIIDVDRSIPGPGLVEALLRPNQGDGVAIVDGTNNLIDRNSILFSSNGVRLSNADQNTVSRNDLGAIPEIGVVTNSGGNRISGARMEDGSDENELSENTCSSNPKCIVVSEGTGNTIQGNLIANSKLEPIDLGDDGSDVNDLLDGDVGPNGRQNAPSVGEIEIANDGIMMSVQGSLSAKPSTTYDIEAFLALPVASSYFLIGVDRPIPSLPRADARLGSESVTTDAFGFAAFTIQGSVQLFGLTGPRNISGSSATLTATDPAGNTSELSIVPDEAGPPLLVQAVLPQGIVLIGRDGETEVRVPIDISNLGIDQAIDVQLGFEFRLPFESSLELDRLVKQEFDGDAIVEDVIPCDLDGGGETPISCNLGDLDGRSWQSLEIIGRVVATAALKGASAIEMRARASATIAGELVETSEIVLLAVEPPAELPIFASGFES